MSRYGRFSDAVREILEGHYYDYGTRFEPGPMSNCDPKTIDDTVELIMDLFRDYVDVPVVKLVPMSEEDEKKDWLGWA